MANTSQPRSKPGGVCGRSPPGPGWVCMATGGGGGAPASLPPAMGLGVGAFALPPARPAGRERGKNRARVGGEAPYRAPRGSQAAHGGMGGFGCPPCERPQRSHRGSPKWDGTFWGSLVPFGTWLAAAFGPLVPFGTPLLVLSSLLG